MRALIVDDSPVMRKVVERALRQAGVELSEVLQAGNGAEALDLLRSTANALDLILSDIHMPGMDGLEFLEQCRRDKLCPDTPVFIVTTETSASKVLRAVAAGARGYLCKPFTSEQIRARIVPILSQRH